MSSNKIRLLIAIPSLMCGGMERNVSIICNNINTDKFDVTLTILDNTAPFFQITNPAIKIIDLKIPSVRKSLFAIARLSRQIRPDIILTTANHLNLFFGIFKWLFPKRVKIIGRESSIMSVNVPTNWNPSFYKWLSRTFYNKLDIIICQSVYMQDDLVKHFGILPAKTCIINNPVEPPRENIAGTQQAKKNVPTFITVARLTALKGLERIIRSLAKLNMPFEYTIIGDGELKEQLASVIKECSLESNVFLAGKSDKPFEKVPNPTLFLLGSYYEGFPNVLLEANALGIPVVAFNVPGGIAELIVNFENGILVNEDNETMFADAVKTALNHPFDRNKISSDIKSRFDIKKIIRQWELLLENVSSEKIR